MKRKNYEKWLNVNNIFVNVVERNSTVWSQWSLSPTLLKLGYLIAFVICVWPKKESEKYSWFTFD